MAVRHSSKIHQILDTVKLELDAISENEMNSKPSIEKWSKKEILGHLIDSAYNNHQRFIRSKKGKDLVFDGYDQVDWVRKNNYQNRSVEEVVNLFIAANRHIAELIAQLKEDDLNFTTVNHNFDKIGMRQVVAGHPSSLAYLIEDYIFHLEHHLGQILG